MGDQDNLSDNVLRLAAPLAEPDRSEFLRELTAALGVEPGEGAAHRAARQLLTSGRFKYSLTADSAKEPRHSGRSVLWDSEPVRYRGRSSRRASGREREALCPAPR
jgi:hypothetical protein